MSTKDDSGLQTCPHCGASMLLIIAANGSLRCKVCARPVGRVSEPSDITIMEPETMESMSDQMVALVAVVFFITILFVPILIAVFLLPILVCCYLDYNERQSKRSDSGIEDGTLY